MNRARTVAAVVLASVLATGTTGCGRGALGQIALVAAVVAVKTVQAVAASDRKDRARTRYASNASMPATRNIDGCGRCPEPDNGYAICFISTCEARCIEGYSLQDDACVPNASMASSAVD